MYTVRKHKTDPLRICKEHIADTSFICYLAYSLNFFFPGGSRFCVLPPRDIRGTLVRHGSFLSLLDSHINLFICSSNLSIQSSPVWQSLTAAMTLCSVCLIREFLISHVIFSHPPSLTLVQKQTLPFDLAAPVEKPLAILSLQTKRKTRAK